ncbi:MAG: hypothetical protein JWN52_8193 [Actinomycetia bacterium]|nr:hypothetical protein [Actinomycetes bacterium]
MTTPAEPDTGAGSQPDTGSAPEAPQTDAQQAAPDTDATDWQAEAEKYKALARKHEDRAKANKRALDEAAQAAQGKAGEPTLDDYKAQLTEAATAREAAEERAAVAIYKSTVDSVAAKVGADAVALRDSGSFQDAVTEELGDDFDDDDLEAAVTKVAKEYAKKPRFAKQTGPARSGADLPGGPGTLRQLTEGDLKHMSAEQIVAAQDKGQLNSLLGIT